MKSSQQPRNRTRMFARVMGPYLAIIAASAALRPNAMRAMLSGFEADPLWSWVTGAFIMLLGSHTYFSMANSAVDAMGWWRTGAAIEVLIGLYLAYVGWMPERTHSVSQQAKPDLPRAA